MSQGLQHTDVVWSFSELAGAKSSSAMLSLNPLFCHLFYRFPIWYHLNNNDQNSAWFAHFAVTVFIHLIQVFNAVFWTLQLIVTKRILICALSNYDHTIEACALRAAVQSVANEHYNRWRLLERYSRLLSIPHTLRHLASIEPNPMISRPAMNPR